MKTQYNNKMLIYQNSRFTKSVHQANASFRLKKDLPLPSVRLHCTVVKAHLDGRMNLAVPSSDTAPPFAPMLPSKR